MRLTAVIPGRPVSMGSKRIGRKGGDPDGQPIILDVKSGPLRRWQAAVREKLAAKRPPALLSGPVRLSAIFQIARPASHYGTGRNAGKLKPSAPAFCAVKPDLDKYVRALGDCLTGLWIEDDGRIAEVWARKVYGKNDGTVVEVEPLETPAAAGTGGRG